MIKRILYLVLSVVMVANVTGCNAYKKEVLGGLIPLTDDQRKGYNALVIRAIGDDTFLATLPNQYKMSYTIDTDSIVLTQEKEEGHWNAYSFSNEDKAYGALTLVRGTEVENQYSKNTLLVRRELISYLNSIRPDNVDFNAYVGYFPLGFNTETYKIDEAELRNGSLYLHVQLSSFTARNKDRILKEQAELDFILLNKARELTDRLNKLSHGDEDVNPNDEKLKVRYINITYSVKGNNTVQDWLSDKDISFYGKFALDRSAIPSQMIGTNTSDLVEDENVASPVCFYEVTTVDANDNYLQGMFTDFETFHSSVRSNVTWTATK